MPDRQPIGERIRYGSKTEEYEKSYEYILRLVSHVSHCLPPPGMPPLDAPTVVTMLEMVKLAFSVPALYVPPEYRLSVMVPVELPPK